MSLKNKSPLAQVIGAIRDAHPEGLTPEQFINAAIERWASMDVFFRTFDPVLLASITNKGNSEFVIFRQEGVTDHYFAMPISSTLLLQRLGFYTPATLQRYAPVINAILMRILDREGFEFFGVLHAPIAYDEKGPVSVRQVEIKPGRLGKILKETAYLGYQMTEEYKGALLLFPKAILMPQGVSNV